MPVTFADLVSRARTWGLDEFVAEANRILPEVVPDASGRAKAEVNARLVRHYATEGILPKPLKDGAEARYDSDHLVRVLALRRLLAEGYASAVAGAFLQRHDRERLARFLLGELRLDLDLAPGGPPAARAAPPPGSATLVRLRALRSRAGLPPLASDDPSASWADLEAPADGPARDIAMGLNYAPSFAPLTVDQPEEPSRPAPQEGGVTWIRYPLLTGLELHVRDDFVEPTTPAAWNALRDAVLARLEAIALERASRR